MTVARPDDMVKGVMMQATSPHNPVDLSGVKAVGQAERCYPALESPLAAGCFRVP
jgi:hypothetical protein